MFIYNLNLISDIPISLGLTVRSGQLFHWIETAEDTFRIIIRRTVIKAYQINDNTIDVEVMGEALDKEQLKAIFGLSFDRKQLMIMLKKDNLLHNLIPAYRGLTIMKQDPYECLISFMASAVSNIPRIMQNLHNLRWETGSPIAGSNEKALPNSEDIVRIGETRLRQIGLGYRSRFIYLTCKKLVEEHIALPLWTKKRDDELLASLTHFPGVGRKIAECAMLFGYSRLSAFPVDVWVRRALARLRPPLTKMSPVDLCEWGRNRWGEAAGLAQQILFCAARDGKIPD